MNKHIAAMMDKIRKAISECPGDEAAVLEELVTEAEGWRMRLDELEAEDDKK